MNSSVSTLEEAYNKNMSKLKNNPKTGVLVEVFGKPPPLMGYSLNDLRSPSNPGFVEAPGPVVDAPTSAQMSSSKQPPSYYLAYNDNEANRMLWFQVNVNDNNDEIISNSGWQKSIVKA
ncbi:hypothetical protein COEREDRAFT_82095 [Coemansia reversa NRRL 1564]|uniref:Uncharacterized protein n=1 Tax=Coemansia reversa (strain ATCC 12441 / NRRL 1564) TaxID=763665 RepID=A0A2G5B8M0_COERN|nr:hypothetical protein COEREDRAFT_82095 [Coemansia reversa NRRL 1564]|eukprot:PIA15344.1 hypothetical protein COEREDRAFT_82095 [Coemansia reversa NRRL 1564]